MALINDPLCSSSTNPPPASIPRSASKSAICSKNCAAEQRPSCSPPTTSRKPSASATASPSWTPAASSPSARPRELQERSARPVHHRGLLATGHCRRRDIPTGPVALTSTLERRPAVSLVVHLRRARPHTRRNREVDRLSPAWKSTTSISNDPRSKTSTSSSPERSSANETYLALIRNRSQPRLPPEGPSSSSTTCCPSIFFFLFAQACHAERAGHHPGGHHGVRHRHPGQRPVRRLACAPSRSVRTTSCAATKWRPSRRAPAGCVHGHRTSLPYMPLLMITCSSRLTRYGMAFPQNPVSVASLRVLGWSPSALGLTVASVVNSSQESNILTQVALPLHVVPERRVISVLTMFPGGSRPLRSSFPPPTWFRDCRAFLSKTNRSSPTAGRRRSSPYHPHRHLLCVKLFRWEKEEKMQSSAKLWLARGRLSLRGLGLWQAHSKDDVRKSKILGRELSARARI